MSKIEDKTKPELEALVHSKNSEIRRLVVLCVVFLLTILILVIGKREPSDYTITREDSLAIMQPLQDYINDHSTYSSEEIEQQFMDSLHNKKISVNLAVEIFTLGYVHGFASQVGSRGEFSREGFIKDSTYIHKWLNEMPQ
jgi:hypothetical protein